MVKLPVSIAKIAVLGVLRLSPVPSNNPAAPPNLKFAVEILESAIGVMVKLFLEESVKVVLLLVPSICRSSDTLLKYGSPLLRDAAIIPDPLIIRLDGYISI
jgi:hypothetical protein